MKKGRGDTRPFFIAIKLPYFSRFIFYPIAHNVTVTEMTMG